MRDVIENQLVGVPHAINVLLGVVRDDAAHNLGVSILELGVSSEVLSLSLISVFVCHI